MAQPLSAKLVQRVINKLKKKLSKILKKFGLSTSTVHHVVKRFRLSEDIEVHNGQG